MLQVALNFIPIYVLVLFRIAGMMIWAPLLGSTQIPKRIKAMIACVLAAAIAPDLSIHLAIPTTSWGLAMAIGGEIVFGAAMGLILSFIFVAAQWAGEMIGQQMGLNLGQTLNPQFGGGSSVVGDLYFFLALLIFLAIGGHLAMIKGVVESFVALPLLSVSMNRPLLDMIISVFEGATLLAMQLGRPDARDHAPRRCGSRVRRKNRAAVEHHDRRHLRARPDRNDDPHSRRGFDQLDHPRQLSGAIRLVLQTYAPH